MSAAYKRILVTGGAGFVGAQVLPILQRKGYEVVVADDLSNPQSQAPKDVEFLKLDMGNPEAAQKAFQGVDACIALASIRGAIGFVARNPTAILTHNNRIYEHTFQQAARAKVKRLVFISSSMVYESSSTYPTPEKRLRDIPMPKSVFAFSKLMGEWHCHSFLRAHQLPFTIIRPANIYGKDEMPGEKVGDTHIIPDVFKKIMAGQYPLELLGDGKQTRSFVHVRDVAKGIVMALESPKAENEDFNLGGNQEFEMMEVARMIWEHCEKKKAFKVKHVEGFPQDVRRQFLDSAKAKKLLSWEPEISFEEGLREVVAHLKTTAKVTPGASL